MEKKVLIIIPGHSIAVDLITKLTKVNDQIVLIASDTETKESDIRNTLDHMVFENKPRSIDSEPYVVFDIPREKKFEKKQRIKNMQKFHKKW